MVARVGENSKSQKPNFLCKFVYVVFSFPNLDHFSSFEVGICVSFVLLLIRFIIYTFHFCLLVGKLVKIQSSPTFKVIGQLFDCISAYQIRACEN
jgi:hypothetical protein